MISAAIMAGTKVAGAAMNMWSQANAIKESKKLYKAQKKLIGERRKTVEMRAEFNEKEIMEAFTENYKRTSFAYGDKIREVVSQKAKTAGEVTHKAVSNLSNVDLQGSSFHNSQMMELNTEFEAATSNLLYNQAQALTDLAAQKESQLTQNRLGVIDANKQFGMEEWQIKRDRDSAIKYQTSKLISGIGGLVTSAKGFQGEFDELRTSLNNGGSIGTTLKTNLASLLGGK